MFVEEALTRWCPSRSAQEEDVSLAPAALEILTKIGSETSLRASSSPSPLSLPERALTRGTALAGYVIQLITLSSLVARRRKAAQVDVPDVRRVYTLCVPSLFSLCTRGYLCAVLTPCIDARRFLDEKRSVQFLREQNSLLIGEDGQQTMDVMDMAA